MKNIRSLLKAGVAGFKCYLNEPDGTCGGKQINQPEKRKAPWLNRSMTVNTALLPPSTNDNGMKELITTLNFGIFETNYIFMYRIVIECHMNVIIL